MINGVDMKNDLEAAAAAVIPSRLWPRFLLSKYTWRQGMRAIEIFELITLDV